MKMSQFPRHLPSHWRDNLIRIHEFWVSTIKLDWFCREWHYVALEIWVGAGAAKNRAAPATKGIFIGCDVVNLLCPTSEDMMKNDMIKKLAAVRNWRPRLFKLPRWRWAMNACPMLIRHRTTPRRQRLEDENQYSERGFSDWKSRYSSIFSVTFRECKLSKQRKSRKLAATESGL